MQVERRRIVLGRLGRVLLPFVLLLAWSAPAYLATPVSARQGFRRYSSDLPLVRMTVAAPVALAWPFAVHSDLFDSWPWYILTVGAVRWDWPGDVPEVVGKTVARMGTIVPLLTVLSFAVMVGVSGLFFSLRCRTWLAAAVQTYVLASAVLAAELVPFIMARGRFEGALFWGAVFGLALALRVALPLLLLRSSIRGFDRLALGES